MDECKESPCGQNAMCTNLPGDYLCSCPTGYKGNPTPDIECVDLDECTEGEKKLCGANATCVNTLGGYFCQCPVGYTGNPRVSCIGNVFDFLILYNIKTAIFYVLLFKQILMNVLILVEPIHFVQIYPEAIFAHVNQALLAIHIYQLVVRV